MGDGRDGTAGPGWFWEIVDKVRSEARTPERHAAGIEEILASQDAKRIVAFDRLLGDRFRESNRHELQGAATLINDGCDEDEFLYFCGWLILQGEAKFKAAIKDPDSIADWIDFEQLPDGVAECEDVLYVAQKAYLRATGEDMPQAAWNKLGDPAGKPVDEDELERKFPKLSGKR